jgi:serine/threonine protein kinase
MKFQYKSGATPLPGYVIKRGIGLGGFGEVYFAVTDGGKEVALKWIRSNHDVEMRGVQQCLNLKHPNLVHLYDVRQDDQKNCWLVMEYVAGEPLSTILNRHQKGVAPELAAQWFQGLAQAIHCLHEHGIVHRDLKPGNIFLENGLIKVGDYGLCKLMADSHHAGMTKDVGTVHYMAPEISTGNYNRQIDIYAAGVLLYEMLTGQVPFEGESAAEILMKHLTTPPDLKKVPKEFVKVVERALAKNPAHRYQTIGEMAKEVAQVVEGQPAWQPMQVGNESAKKAILAGDIPEVLPVTPSMIFQERWSELTSVLLWSLLASAGLALGWVLLTGKGDYSKLAPIFFVSVACTWIVVIPNKLWPPSETDDSWTRRLIQMCLGFGVAIFALWLEGYELIPWAAPGRLEVLQPWHGDENTLNVLTGTAFGWIYRFENTSMPVIACYLAYFGLTFLVLRWWKTTEAERPSKFSIKPLLAVAFWAYVLLFLMPSAPHREVGFVSLVTASIVTQLACPWREKIPVVKKKKVRLATA